MLLSNEPLDSCICVLMLLLRLEAELCFEPILLPRQVELLRELGTLRPLLSRATMGMYTPVPVLGLSAWAGAAAASVLMAVESIFCSRQASSSLMPKLY